MSTRRHSTRQNNRGAREERVRSGNTISALDWKCPHCHQCFARIRSGTANHYKRCPSRPKRKLVRHLAAPAEPQPTRSAPQGSEYDSESYSDHPDLLPWTTGSQIQPVEAHFANEGMFIYLWYDLI